MKTKEQLLRAVGDNRMVQSYLETALWASRVNGVGDDSFKDKDFKIEDCTNSFLAEAIRSCNGFLESIRERGVEGGTLEDIGHDFFLARNNFGVGFVTQDISEEHAIWLNLEAKSRGRIYLFTSNGRVQSRSLPSPLPPGTSSGEPGSLPLTAVKHVQDMYQAILTGGLLAKARRIAKRVQGAT